MGFVAQLVDPQIIGKMTKGTFKNALNAVLKRNKDIAAAVDALKKKKNWQAKAVDLIRRNPAVQLALIDEMMRRRRKA